MSGSKALIRLALIPETQAIKLSVVLGKKVNKLVKAIRGILWLQFEKQSQVSCSCSHLFVIDSKQ